ncbi:hypothetical protein ABES02_05215 [Neobacillus pocheonensis]
MEKNNYETDENQSRETDQEDILNRVNQTFDKISQDVKNMINNNQMT